jgi:hypothetical protein
VSCTIAQLKKVLPWANSYQRMPLLIEALPPRTDRRQRQKWLRLLKDEWISCDNIGPYRDDLVWAFQTSAADWHLLMDAAERVRYDTLPSRVRLFRGCGPINRLGLSWTEDRDVAVRFPRLNRYRTPRPMLLEAVVPKERVVAAKNGRGEDEVIALVGEQDVVKETIL